MDELQRQRPPHTIIENRAILDKRLTAYDKLVLMVLCYHADMQDNKCWPSYDTIAKEAPCSRRTAIESVKHLIEYGYLVKTTRDKPNSQEKTSNLYTITWAEGSASHAPPSASPAPPVVHHVHGNKNHMNKNQGRGNAPPELISELRKIRLKHRRYGFYGKTGDLEDALKIEYGIIKDAIDKYELKWVLKGYDAFMADESQGLINRKHSFYIFVNQLGEWVNRAA